MNNKKLYKSRTNKYIGGVCGGIGEYLDFDPTLIRLITVLGSFASSGLLALIYILFCFILPYEPINPYTGSSYSSYSYNNSTYSNVNSNVSEKKLKNEQLLGIFLIIVGSIWFLNNILPNNIAKFIAPICIIIFGLCFIVSAVSGKKDKVSYTTKESTKEEGSNNE